jgi:hypothetical protein
MNTLDVVNNYLRRIERALRLLALTRGAAITAGVALAATVLLAVLIYRNAFAPGTLVAARFALFLSIGIAVAFGVVIPLLGMNRRRAARHAEQVHPEFEQRLLTIAEREDVEPQDPFLVLIAGEAEEVARRATPAASRGKTAAFLTSAAGAAAVLLWLILAGPGSIGEGASLLWAGAPKTGAGYLREIKVTPGNATVRRKTDQWVNANLHGFDSPDVRIFARFRGGAKWEESPMVPRTNGTGYEFLFAALPDDVEYYVAARGAKSDTYKLSVRDLPGIRKLKVTYHYPKWTGLGDKTEEPGGDLRAIEGTVADLEVEFDKPIRSAAIALDNGQSVALEGDGAVRRAAVPIEHDGMYHFASAEGGDTARLSEDYFIEAQKDSAPDVKIERPGRDARVSPIEEVPVVVRAGDQFGLHELAVHYSVNGGPERTVDLLPRGGGKEATGNTLITLEEMKLSPGDVVALYATARGARTVSRTDILFLEAQPYDRQYSQAQEAGGGGGAGGDFEEQRISTRQKQVIAATWNDIRDERRTKNAAEDARFLSEVELKLRGQAQSMAERSKSRELAGTNDSFQYFVKELEEAAKEMGAAADKLKAQALRDALPAEQRALQHIMRSEMAIKDIQVAFGSRAGGQGGGAARDLENLFDLELDTEKNQYETGQQLNSANQRQQQIDEALQRLEQLARRQQELADQQKQKQQAFEQRWQQEQLRREAEELRRQMEQLSRQNSSGSQSSQQSGSQQDSSSGSQGQSSSAADRSLRQAFDRLSRATDDMRQAASQPDQRDAAARRAAERLKEAQDILHGMRKGQSSSQLSDLGDRAERLLDQQRQFTEKMRQAFGAESLSSRGQDPSGRDGREQNQRLGAEKDQMARQLDQLQADTQRAARDLQGSQPEAARKLREGLSEVQQNEIQLRMKYAANWIRNGRGALMTGGEAVTTASLGKLRDDIRDAQQTVERGGEGDKNGSGDKNEQALQRLERAREALDSAARRAAGRQQQSGKQPGSSQEGARQQNGGQQQQGGQQQGGQQGGSQPGGQESADGSEGGGPQFGPGGGATEGAIRQALNDLTQLRRQFGADNGDFGRGLSDAIRALDRIEKLPLAGPEMDARIQREVMPALEQLELQLRRKVDEAKGGARDPSAERIPPGYADRVADYFRRLSRAQ